MKPKNATLKEIQQARFAIERKALTDAAKDPTIVGVLTRLYRHAREMAVQGRADPYLVGRADALEDMIARLEMSKGGNSQNL